MTQANPYEAATSTRIREHATPWANCAHSIETLRLT